MKNNDKFCDHRKWKKYGYYDIPENLHKVAPGGGGVHLSEILKKWKKFSNGPLNDQSTFGELMPCDRAQNLEHFLLLRHYLKI
jgi:hypothetical protein